MPLPGFNGANTCSEVPKISRILHRAPENAITLQCKDVNLQFCNRVETRIRDALGEDSLQDLTPLLESLTLNYKRSLVHASSSPKLSAATVNEINLDPPESLGSLGLSHNVLPRRRAISTHRTPSSGIPFWQDTFGYRSS
jgi:hypothetical protein